jgi:hypothetical protein
MIQEAVGAAGTTPLPTPDATGMNLGRQRIFNDFPLSLDPGESFSGTLFSIALPSNLAAGLYTGSFEILGGADSDALETLFSVDFQVNVAPTASTVPEPESLMLVVAGLPGVALLVQRKWRRFSDSKT